MIIVFWRGLFYAPPEHPVDRPLDAEYEPLQDELSLAGLAEEELRKLDPDDRVATQEQTQLDPYNYIYLAC